MSDSCVILDTVTGEQWALDATTTLGLSYAATPTAHPVELGVAIIDHVQPQATPLTISGYVSESPTKAGQDEGAARVARWKAFLEGLRLGHPITVVGYRINTLQNMAFVSCPFEVTSTRAIKVQMVLQQIVVVTATLVANIGATNSTSNVTNATAKTAGATAPIDPTALQSALDGANLTAQANLAAQSTTKANPTPKQTSVAYELAHSAGLV